MTTMQPGDYVLKSDIADEETLNWIREAVGYHRPAGMWEYKDNGPWTCVVMQEGSDG